MKKEKEIRMLVVDDNESLVGMLKDYFEDHEKRLIMDLMR